MYPFSPALNTSTTVGADDAQKTTKHKKIMTLYIVTTHTNREKLFYGILATTSVIIDIFPPIHYATR